MKKLNLVANTTLSLLLMVSTTLGAEPTSSTIEDELENQIEQMIEQEKNADTGELQSRDPSCPVFPKCEVDITAQPDPTSNATDAGNL